MTDNIPSKTRVYTLADPENDLFSDAMDRAVSMYHSVRHGAMRNAERAGEGHTMDGERLARTALAAGFKAYLEEIGPTAHETDSTLRRVAQHILEEARNAFPANHCLVPRVLIGTLREALREPKVAYNSNGDAYLVEPKVVVEQPNDPEPVECPVCRQMTLWPGTCAGTKDGSHWMPAQNCTAG